MITCKEDLFNGYIENKPGELRDLLFDKCNEFGIGINIGSVKSDYLEVYSCDSGESDPYELVDCGHLEVDSMRLTLSDFKPTRTKYEKVTESIFDLRDEFERGELYHMGYNKDYYLCENVIDLSIAMDIDNCYRKVEKEIDWTVDVMDFLRSELQRGESVKRADVELFCDGSKFINLDASLPKDRFLEMCRVALRANGEIE